MGIALNYILNWKTIDTQIELMCVLVNSKVTFNVREQRESIQIVYVSLIAT